MSAEDYKEALKAGQREYRRAVSRGMYPYLPVLDEIIRSAQIETEINLGLVEIPTSKIVGTSTAGRTRSFAGNFMPILPQDSEFGTKWINLSNALADEGLRDPVKAYEYMNNFYIMEGNKRVSVMKFLGAVSIPGIVVRKIPKRTDSPDSRLYYEFMHFYGLSGINYLDFTQPGSYIQLQKELGMEPDEVWTDDDKKIFHSFYIRFSDSYRSKLNDDRPENISDAMLVYLKIYPYESAKTHMPQTFKENIAKSREELLGAGKVDTVKLSMQPSAIPKNVFKKLITTTSATSKRQKVAFIYDKNPEVSGWAYGHELGRLHLENVFNDKISTSVYKDVDPADTVSVKKTIEKAISDGNRIIFTTTPKFMQASVQAAIDHPDVRILNCSLNTSYPSIRAYYARMFEAKFLVGAIAGALSPEDRIGYIADYPIYGSIANINAFAIGARMTNPRAKIILEWSKVKGHEVHKSLEHKGVYFVSDKDVRAPEKKNEEFGLYFPCGENDEAKIVAVPVWHWGKFYELILRSIFSGTWKTEEPESSTKTLNYWWGMSSGVVDVVCSKSLPDQTQRLVKLLEKDICDGSFYPFSGILKDQQGNIMYDDEKPMSPESIIQMNWLLENVEGSIPVIDELEDSAKEIVLIQGVNKTEDGILK